ncbi:MAG: tetratricopeptide repeat protein [Sulfuricellaceae bacterium]|nr:tetratricopeptide repeat protein [Sulfuricellaceae bacterium]
MAFDLEEQEQLDAIKSWWKQYGSAVTLGVTLFVVIVLGMQGWRYYQGKQSAEAAALFAVVQSAAESQDIKKLRELAGQVIDKYPSSGFAVRAALLASKASQDSGDLKSAKAQLQWVLDHSKSDEIRDAARLKLAGMLLDEKAYDEALKQLETKHGAAFDGLYEDMRGDVLAASGKTPEAISAYKIVLEKLEPNSAYRSLVQIKLEGLGGS